ncbi:MAG: EAL domain-containing protein, partial [Cellvibrionaceae bacterium]|nr:EAL domain-containing protein [Cellvibrionaceae bacterium]
LSLYDKDGKLQHAWGKSLPLPKDTIKRALSRGQTGPKLSCGQTCSHSVLVPVLGSEGPQLLQLDTQLAPLLNDFRRISKADIGIISAVPSNSKSNNNGTNISAWNQRLIHLTQEQNTLPILQRLARQQEFQQLQQHSRSLSYLDRVYDISVFTLPQFLDSRLSLLMMTDITQAATQAQTSEKRSLTRVLPPVAVACALFFLALLRPINRMIRQSRVMSSLIKGDYDSASRKLKRQKPNLLFTDEIDQLLEAENELSTQLDELQIQLAESNEELKNLAMSDNLTGLANRYRLEKEIKRHQRSHNRYGTAFALLFLDLDNFKRINDSLGHKAGDELLSIVSKRLKACVRAADVVGRLGGDEFCIVIDNLKAEAEAQKVAQHILNTLIMPIHLRGTEINISASIGIAVAPQDGLTSSELLQNADLAMYQAKALGRNKFCAFSKELTQRAARQLSLENELRNALANREFVLYFQPQVNIDNCQICGVETLIRWQHPSKGLQYPDQFIDTLEETGLIVPVGEWVLKESCRLLSSWIKAGIPPFKIAVNISARQFTDPGFFRSVEKNLSASGLPSEYLELEITESMVMGNIEDSSELLQQLRGLGVTLSIDDFGTGYSSLSYLKTLPVDILKVDRSFVMDIPHSQSDMEITAAIIAMAHKLQLKVVAEGIENPEQHEFLKQNGCDYGQGYMFAKPLSQQALLKRLHQQRLAKHQAQQHATVRA